MCILVVVRNRVEGRPLLVGANRDEFRDRPWSEPARDGEIVCPRDLRAGGTWIALHDSGLLVAVTNRPDDDPDPSRPSRGLLALEAARTGSVAAACALVTARLSEGRRNAFHMLLADTREACVLVHPSTEPVVPIPDGMHTLSNRHGLDELDHRGLLDPVDFEPGTPPETAVAAMKKVLGTHGPEGPSAICKHGPDRGTLSSSVIALPEWGSAGGPEWWFAPGAPCETEFFPVRLR